MYFIVTLFFQPPCFQWKFKSSSLYVGNILVFTKHGNYKLMSILGHQETDTRDRFQPIR